MVNGDLNRVLYSVPLTHQHHGFLNIVLFCTSTAVILIECYIVLAWRTSATVTNQSGGRDLDTRITPLKTPTHPTAPFYCTLCHTALHNTIAVKQNHDEGPWCLVHSHQITLNSNMVVLHCTFYSVQFYI